MRHITPRMSAMVGWMCWGLDDREIGELFHVSHRTVGKQIAHARLITDSKNRPVLARWYVLNIEMPWRFVRAMKRA